METRCFYCDRVTPTMRGLFVVLTYWPWNVRTFVWAAEEPHKPVVKSA